MVVVSWLQHKVELQTIHQFSQSRRRHCNCHKGIYANQPMHRHPNFTATYLGSSPILNVKAQVCAFNQEKVLVWPSSLIVNTDGSFAALI